MQNSLYLSVNKFLLLYKANLIIFNFVHYLDNFRNSILLLRLDFLGFNFHLQNYISIFIFIIFSLSLFTLFIFLGNRIRNLFFPFTNKYFEKHYINISLGFIFLSSVLAIVGFISELNSNVIIFILLISILISIFPFNSFRSYFLELKDMFKRIKISKSDFNILNIFILFLVLIYFLRLIPPEIGADAVSYHTTFPRLYLFFKTMMIPPFGTESYITVPQLGEMPFVLTQFFKLIDASRYIHFIFFLLSLGMVKLISKNVSSEKHYSSLVLLIILTTPLLLHISVSANSDLPAIFLFLVSIYLLIKSNKVNLKTYVLSGLILGGAIATKIWILIYIPAILIYIFYRVKILDKDKIIYVFRLISAFLISLILISGIWFLRSYLLSGHFIYLSEIISPEIESTNTLSQFKTILNFSDKLKHYFFSDYSPLFFLGILFAIIVCNRILKQFRNILLIILSFLIFIFCLILPVDLINMRYLLPIYFLLCFIAGIGLLNLYKYILGKIILIFIIFILSIYFSLNSFIFLPYGLGLANKENYLIQKSIAGNFYYDFNQEFKNEMRPNEIILVHNLSTFYYADFIHLNIYHIFKKENNKFSELKKYNINKLLIRGGDINWFCNELDVIDCSTSKVILITKYDPANLYLYKIE